MERFVVKIQRALFGSDEILVYDEGRSFMMRSLELWDDPLVRRFMGDEAKVFGWAHIDPKGLLVLNLMDGPAPWQEW